MLKKFYNKVSGRLDAVGPIELFRVEIGDACMLLIGSYCKLSQNGD
jgi:hypothetical protein